MKWLTLGAVLLCSAASRAEQVIFELEWGFGPEPSEIYWDGRLEVEGGSIVSIEAVSFETDRHDKLTPPDFRSLTLNRGTDGMKLVVEAGEEAAVRLESKEGTFEWTIAQMQRRGTVEFPSRSKGRLVVRMIQFLGRMATLLSDRTTQDSDPAVCRLSSGGLLVVWRAFLGLPTPETAGGDQMRVTVVDRQGNPGKRSDLLKRPGDVEKIAVVPESGPVCTVVWAEQRQHNWDLYTTSLEIDGGDVRPVSTMRLTDDPGVDKSPALAVGVDGSLALAWQGWRGGRSVVFFRRRLDGRWGDVVRLSDRRSNAWNPAIAARDGSVAVVWSTWRGGSYDVDLRVDSGSGVGPCLGVGRGERFQAHPSLSYDRTGSLWIAYEEGREGWGMHSHTAGLRTERNLRLRLYRNRRIEEPTGTAALKLPSSFENRSEMAYLAQDGHGVLWLLFRHMDGRGRWSVVGSSLGDEGWSVPRPLHRGAGGQNVRMAAVPGDSGDLVALWPSDHRTNQVGKDSHLYASRLPRRKPRTLPVEGREVAARAGEARRTDKSGRMRTTVGEQELGLYFGDLHRHTELSVCQTSVDGSLEDAFRYAIDAAGLDFLCVTDHVQHVKILSDYDYWRTGKTADLHRVSGLHQPFYGYERSQRWPYGHRNIIGLRRDTKRVPRTADNRPWSANNGYPGEVRVTPPELWSRLLGQNVVAIPHTTGNPVMGTDFGHEPPPLEPVVEIYQGCRISYEYASAPDPREQRDGSRFGGATKEGGFIWDALAKGYRYGFIASSDHLATSNSYACVWAGEFSNASILDALRQRRSYAATARILCDMRMGGHMMGAEFAAAEVPPLEVRVVGTATLERIDVIKDNKVVFTHRSEKPSREARFAFRDLEVAPGTHYYYTRVIQKDRNMAWVTPIWVNVAKR